jgi:hypothetical protein
MSNRLDKKKQLDHMISLDICGLKRDGFLTSFNWQSIIWRNEYGEIVSRLDARSFVLNTVPYMELKYALRGDYQAHEEPFSYRVYFSSTECNYGGRRLWFVCPLLVKGIRCGRRCRILYLDNGLFGCRFCHNLSYRSQNINRKSKYFYLYRIIDTEEALENLFNNMKRWHYAGKPTRKMLKYLHLRAIISSDYQYIVKKGELI